MLDQIKVLDVLADGPGLSPDDWIRRYALEASLLSIYRSEELFWQRRAGQNWLLKGDANTAYFEAIANGRTRKCAIPFLWDGDVLLESPDDISTHIYSFCKELFSTDLRGGVSLCTDFWTFEAQVSDVGNEELTLPFSHEEVGKAIASMKACSALGPHGLPVLFFQKFWEFLRPVVMPMFHEFYIRTMDVARIHFWSHSSHTQSSWGVGYSAIPPHHGSDSDIVHLKFLFLCFEEMSGLKINFDKSEVVVLGYCEGEQHRIVDNLNCRLASFPVSYLGMPLAESRILVSGFDPLVG
ncbi:putative NOT transcription complex subunit VIP2 [Hordeum vulgare]|nr:putative NOT transcription complex subunit VIP2 [Hordeum vulgare]